MQLVVPCVGTWIEIIQTSQFGIAINVVPCVGTWIEIEIIVYQMGINESFPVWERGLKYISSSIYGLRTKSFPVWERGLK